MPYIFRKSVVLLPSFLCLFSSSSFAQELRYQFDDEVVVTGTKTPKTLLEAPVKTEVIDQERLETHHYKSVEEALPHLPGVNITESDRRAGKSAVIQGLGEDHVLILVDGVPQLQTSSYGFDLSQISTSEVEKIEVVKGGASALYGSQAMGGVINIITKKGQKKTAYSVDVEGGQYLAEEHSSKSESPLNVSGALSGSLKELRYRFNLAGRTRKGFDRDTRSVSEDVSANQKLNASVYLAHPLVNNDQVYANYRVFSEDIESVSGIPSPSFGVERRNNRTSLLTKSFTLGFDRSSGETSRQKAFVLHEVAEDELVLSDNPSTSFVETQKESVQRTTRFEVQSDALIFQRHLVTLGTVISQTSLEQINFTGSGSGVSRQEEVAERSHSAFEAYAQDDIIFERWEVVPGLRLQNDQDFGQHLSPKVSLRYSLESFGDIKTNLRASVGTGYRVPSLKERFYYLDHRSFANYIVEGNNNLKPESSVSYQLGAEWLFDKRNHLYFNFFYNDVKDLINTELVDSGTPELIYRYQNINSVRIPGFEIKTSNSPLSWLSSEVSYTYSQATLSQGSKKVPFRPESVALASVTVLPAEEVSSIFTYRYQSKEYVDTANTSTSPGYGVLDAKINYYFKPTSIFYLGVDNLLNETRSPVSDDGATVTDRRPEVGRFFYLGFQIKS